MHNDHNFALTRRIKLYEHVYLCVDTLIDFVLSFKIKNVIFIVILSDTTGDSFFKLFMVKKISYKERMNN